MFFIDEAVIDTARPSGQDMQQRVTHHGDKYKNALKFQSVTTPDGLCIHLHGIGVGHCHDMFLYASSDVDEQLRHCLVVNGKQFSEYGDSGYTWCIYLEVCHAGSHLSVVKRTFNKTISAVRISFELYFKCVKHLRSIVGSKREMRVKKMPMGIVYRAAALLTNLDNCVQPNQIAQYFECSPRKMEEYICRFDNLQY